MTSLHPLRNHAARAATLAIVVTLFGFARATSGQSAPADAGLRFASEPLGAAHREEARSIRAVNPRYARIDAGSPPSALPLRLRTSTATAGRTICATSIR